MNFKKTVLFWLLFGSSFALGSEGKIERPACSVFRVHLATVLPLISQSEKNSAIALPPELALAIDSWKTKLDFLKDETERARWIECIRQFIFMDTDHDGIADWTALVDGRPSRTLFPFDTDIDGDGIPNILDADPYVSNAKVETSAFPGHLQLPGANAVKQKKFWKDFQILFVNHSDKHIADVIDSVSSILELKSIRKLRKGILGVDVIYSFSNRNPEGEVAAYHPTARAISVPGLRGFGTNSLSAKQKCDFRSSILHELGHSFLFAILSASELKAKATSLGGWQFPDLAIENLFSAGIFDASRARRPAVVSDYANANVHEWFAESFAAYIWAKESLDRKGCHAFNKKRVSKELGQWLESLLAGAQ